jgi:DNA-binding beta-propeller fold protein YncE/4-amino-4-deoxy-L-arabinose transferase-like glycosyltransferase
MVAVRRLPLSVGLLVLLAVAWRAQWAFQFVKPRANGGWVLLAALLALCALWMVAERSAAPGAADRPPLGGRREWLAVGALCALGIACRIVHFSSVPGGMNHDAAFNGMYALGVLQGAPYTPYISAAWGRETLFMYLCTPLVAWLGNVPEPIQIAATLVAVATLPVFYLFARALFPARVALTALAFLAVSGWHGVFSRVGWRMIMVPPFELLALLGLWRALDRGARRDWVLTGVGTAGAIYTYDAGRAVPLMVGVLFLVFLFLDRPRWRPRVLGGIVVLTTFLLVGGPMLWYAATHFDQFKARAEHLATEEQHGGPLASAVTAAGMFNYRGNGNDFFVDEPLLEPLAAVLFAFGVALVLLRTWRSSRDQRRRYLFVVVGLAMALLPGLPAVPNGNRCINALPFAYLIAALGADALAAAVSRPLSSAAAPRATVVLLALFVGIAAVEMYREFLGPQRRPILGFSPEATAGGEYLRRFGDDYTRYVIAGNWPEYTLDYLSYNGGGTPFESHYLMGHRLEEIEARINRYGRKGLVFVTDLDTPGRQALERLQRLFADHRIEPVTAARLGGEQVATALIVDPQRASVTGLWSDTTRALAVGGDAPATAVRCFDPVSDTSGVSVRLQLMSPQLGRAAPGGEVRFLSQCPPASAAPLAVGFGVQGLIVRADHGETAVPATALEGGRWYEVNVMVRPDGALDASVDGRALTASKRLATAGQRPLRIAGIEIDAPAGAAMYVDDVAVVPGRAAPGDERWAAARANAAGTFWEDFETLPFGLLSAGGEWRHVEGPVSALGSPAHGARAEAAPVAGGNAFDGGHGNGPGQFNQPMGIAVDGAGDLFVADKENHRVQKFARDGTFERAWGEQGDQPGQFKEPHDVAVDAEFVYVADTWNQRIQVFGHDGAPVFIITGSPSFSSPRGLFVKDKLIYVAEAGAGHVTVYDRAGALRRTIGVMGGDGPGHLIEPVDVVVDAHGDVWVVNSGNNRVEHFGPDGSPRGSFPVPGWSGHGLKEVSLDIDPEGTLYLSDWDHGSVRRFRPDGSELPSLGAEIRQPSGVVAERDRVLVVARAEDVVHVLPLDAPKIR